MSTSDYMESIRINKDLNEIKKINENDGKDYLTTLYHLPQRDTLTEK